MNIFTAAVTGLTIVIKKIGIGFKAIMTGAENSDRFGDLFHCQRDHSHYQRNCLGHQIGGDADCQFYPFAFQDVFAA